MNLHRNDRKPLFLKLGGSGLESLKWKFFVSRRKIKIGCCSCVYKYTVVDIVCGPWYPIIWVSSPYFSQLILTSLWYNGNIKHWSAFKANIICAVIRLDIVYYTFKSFRAEKFEKTPNDFSATCCLWTVSKVNIINCQKVNESLWWNQFDKEKVNNKKIKV